MKNAVMVIHELEETYLRGNVANANVMDIPHHATNLLLSVMYVYMYFL